MRNSGEKRMEINQGNLSKKEISESEIHGKEKVPVT